MFMRKTMRLLRNIEYLVGSIAKFMIDHGESSMVKIIAVNAGDMKIVEDGKKEYVAEDLVGHDVLIHVSGMIGSSPIELVHVTASSDCGKYITYSVDQKTCWVHISNVVSVFGIDEAPVNPLIPTRESKEKADCEDDVDLESPYRFLETR